MGTTALHRAIYEENLEVASTLIALGADPNIVDNCQRTALHLAVIYEMHDLIPQLVLNGANLNITAQNEGTALQLAVARGNIHASILLNILQTKLFSFIEPGYIQLLANIVENLYFKNHLNNILHKESLNFPASQLSNLPSDSSELPDSHKKNLIDLDAS